jgi:hypothetical protein
MGRDFKLEFDLAGHTVFLPMTGNEIAGPGFRLAKRPKAAFPCPGPRKTTNRSWGKMRPLLPAALYLAAASAAAPCRAAWESRKASPAIEF